MGKGAWSGEKGGIILRKMIRKRGYKKQGVGGAHELKRLKRRKIRYHRHRMEKSGEIKGIIK